MQRKPGFAAMRGALIAVLLALATLTGGLLAARVPGNLRFAIKTFETDDGDIIDCVDFYKQPSFLGQSKRERMMPRDHRLHDNSTLTLGRSNRTMETTTSKNRPPVEKADATAVRNNSTAGRCPPGSIPIRRAPKTAAGSRIEYASSTSRPSRKERAVAYTAGGGPFAGARGFVTVWGLDDVQDNEYSMSYISAGRLGSGSRFNPVAFTDMIISGWMVYPSLSGDHKTRFFVGWSNDNGETTGCLNLDCPGFVHTNPDIPLGATFESLSVYNNIYQSYGFQITLYADPNLPKWYVGMGDQVVGYWPIDVLFPNFWKADRIAWGGEVLNTWPGGLHTTTQMGSGHYSFEGNGRASYFRKIQVRRSSTEAYSKYKPSYFRDQPACYDTREWRVDDDGYWFFYGGPGGQNCAS